MFTLQLDPDLTETIPGLRLGGLLFTDVRSGPSPQELLSQMEEAARQAAREIRLEEVASLPGPAGWRRVLRRLGTDPTRYRVSSERLLRRVIKGDKLPEINVLADLCNLWSLKSTLPAGLYDADRLAGSVLTLGVGRSGEAYYTLAHSEMQTEGKVVLRDAEGPCGSPITDSMRTGTDESTRRCLLVIYAPPGYPRDELERHMDVAADWYTRYAGGHLQQRLIVEG
ncbi:MAG TPA: phenylalanine--tRNA ligase beta subunit-related protein [Symbiobacteriaceae bacterium]